MTARATKTIAAAALLDADGFKTTIATEASIQTYTGGAINGAAAAAGPAHGFAYIPSATASSSADSYVAGSTIQFVGTYRGLAVTRTATVVGTDGNTTFLADGPLEGPVTSIIVGAQADTSGAWLFGWTDALPASRPGPTTRAHNENVMRNWLKLVATSAANVHVGYGNMGAVEDTVPLVVGQELEAPVTRLYGDSTAGVTIYTE